MIVHKPYGRLTPSLAYDVTRGALYVGAKKSAVRRYGKAPNDLSDDSRPLGPDYTRQVLASGNDKANWSGAPDSDLFTNPNAGTDGAYLVYLDATPNQPVTLSNSSIIIEDNQPFTLSNFIYPKSKIQLGALDRVRFGEGLEGRCFFQIREGRPEIGEFSKAWNQSEETELQNLWKLKEPTPTESARIDAITKKIYADYEQLSFENTTGKTDWVGQQWTLSFIPEPKGFVHIVLEGGGDAFSHECTRVTKTKKAGVLWKAGAVEMSTLGGAFFFQFQRPTPIEGTVTYGPMLPALGTTNPFAGLTSRVNADQSAGTATFERISYEGYSADYFGLKLTLSPTTGFGPWVYGANVRTPAPTRASQDGDPVFDTAKLYKPPDGSSLPHEKGNPILDMTVECQPDCSRCGRILMRDVMGKTYEARGVNSGNGFNRVIHHCADFTIKTPGADDSTATPIFTDNLIYGGRYTDARRYAYTPTSGVIEQASENTAKGETRSELFWADFWYLAAERKCRPPVISDLLRLGYAIDAVLRVMGRSLYSGHDLGPIIDGPALGEAWASTSSPDSNVADLLRGLMDRYGMQGRLPLRLRENNLGQIILETVSSSVQGNFTSDGTKNDPTGTVSGKTRRVIQAPLDWEADVSNFFNVFTLVYGKDGKEQVARVRDEASISQFGYVNYIGREKEYDEIRASDIRTAAAAQIALRSYRYRYGRFTQYAQSPTYYHRDLLPGSVWNFDGLKGEIVSIDGCSIASDAMQIRWGRLA